MLGKLLTIGAVLLLLLAPAASAQTRVTETTFTATGEGAQSDPSVGIKAGDGAFGFINMEYCWAGPGLNPNSGTVTAEITLTTPEWLTAIPPEPYTWTPNPTETSQEGACQKEQAQVSFTIANDAPKGETGEVAATVTITEDANMEQSTYMSQAGTRDAQFAVKVAEPEVDPITGQPQGSTNTTTPTAEPPAEESPLPTPMIPLLALIGIAALRRRR